MGSFDLSWLPFEPLAMLTAVAPDPVVLAMALLALTAALVAMCVPGVIVPLAFCSGALLGGWAGVLVVVTGALLGSQALFLIVRTLLKERVRFRLGKRLARLQALEHHVARRGLFYVAGLRVAGVPHFLVTAASALTPLGAGSFALATLLGFLPVVALTAAAGALV